MKITIVAGARPNFMKIAPITRAIDAAKAQGKRISYRLVYTGIENDTSLDASLFADLHMKAPDAYSRFILDDWDAICRQAGYQGGIRLIPPNTSEILFSLS